MQGTKQNEQSTSGIEHELEAFELRDAPRVRQYVADHPHLLPPILESMEIVPRYFDLDRRMVLEITDDPEEESAESEELFLLIPTELEPEEAGARLKRLDDDWWEDWLAVFANTSAWTFPMHIDVEYV